VHKSTETLLAVPRYSDLLEDQYHEDKSERGGALVSSAGGWRAEMAKWISEAREAELEESDNDEERGDVIMNLGSRHIPYSPSDPLIYAPPYPISSCNPIISIICHSCHVRLDHYRVIFAAGPVRVNFLVQGEDWDGPLEIVKEKDF
jgi:hypothetical protein